MTLQRQEIYTMLVLSRGTQDKVLFPKLGISVEILRIANKRVRLGITAPKDVKVVRDELLANLIQQSDDQSSGQTIEELLGCFSEANNLLRMAASQLENDQVADAMSTLSQALHTFDTIERDRLAPPKSEESTATSANVRRALLVDDDDNERELLAGYLRLTGFDVTEADDGFRALYRLSEHRSPDIVLLDMNMPGLDGQSTLQRIRQSKQHANLPVIAVSGSNPEDVGVVVGPGGVNLWYRKPVKPKQLVEQMTELIAAAV